MAEAARILVVGPAWVGDMVMAQSLFITLAQQHPGAQIDVVASPWSLPLLARMPQVHRGIALSVPHGRFGLAARWRLGRELRHEHYDQAIVIPRSWKSALVPFLAGARRRTGYRGEMRYGLLNDIRPLDKAVLRRTVERYVALGLPADTPLPPAAIPEPQLRVDSANRERLLAELGLRGERPAVAMMPGAEYGPSKRWPLAHYAQLAARLQAEGRQVWLFGSERDRDDAERIIALSGASLHNLCGRTRLEDAVDLLSACSAAVTNDSGLMHVAAAVGIPLVAIYGSSTPDYTPPLSIQATVLYRGLDCSPCFKRECPLGHLNCLNEITPESVYDALSQSMESDA